MNHPGQRIQCALILKPFALLCLLIVLFVGATSSPIQADIIYSTNFEDANANKQWTVDNGVWTIGTPAVAGVSPHQGKQCAGTSINDYYPEYTPSTLISPTMDLPKLGKGQQILLRFWQWFNWDEGNGFASGQVQVSIWNGTKWNAWQPVSEQYNASSRGWHYAGTSHLPIDLSAFAGKRIRIGFLHDGRRQNGSAAGWYIDEVSVSLENIVEMPLNTLVTFEGFTATDWQGWTNHNGIWDIGTPNLPPNSAHQASQSAGTSINDHYPEYTTSLLASPPVSLPKLNKGQQILLRFWQWFNWDEGNGFASGQVQVSTWSGTKWNAWQPVSEKYNASSRGWHYAGTSHLPIDLSAFAGKRIRIGFFHDGRRQNGSAEGWFIDEVSVNVENVVEMPLNVPVTFEGFTATDWQGWTNHNGVWDIGTPNLGPNSAHEGIQAAGTSINDYYPEYTTSLLASPAIDLSTFGGKAISLKFWHWYSWDEGNGFASGQVYVSTWSGSKWNAWRAIGSAYHGDSGNWKYVGKNSAAINLSSYAGKRIRLGFLHDGRRQNNVNGGWYLDEITVVLPAATISGFTPGSGSVGTPVVISGSLFQGATAVAFNGKPASFVVRNSTEVDAVVPVGATTGKITVVTPGGTATSTTDFVVLNSSIRSLSLNPDTLVGGASSSAIVTLSTKAPAGGAVITLSSTDTTLATLPVTSITIPEGKSSATFTVNSLAVPSTKTVDIVATAPDGTTNKATLTLKPKSIGTLEIDPSIIAGGDNAFGILTLNSAVASDTTVTLSADSAAVTIPASLTMPKGTKQLIFNIDSSAVTSAITVTITATVNKQKFTAYLTLTP